MSARVRITDVSPRDGLQNEPIGPDGPIPTMHKVELIRAAAASGVDEVEVTSFVSPRWVPQLGDAAELCDTIASESAGWACARSALVPNEKGLDALLSANQRAGHALINKVSVFTAASETFSQRNTNASIAQTIERFGPVVSRAKENGLAVRGYVSCMVACPFEGAIEPAAVARVGAELRELGIEEIDLGDTIGKGTPQTIAGAIKATLDAIGPAGDADGPRITLHLHDTFGGAAACVHAALDCGVRSFDASFGGLGGCPYASTPGSRAPGNISMRTLLDVVEHAGYRHSAEAEAAMSADSIATRIGSVS